MNTFVLSITHLKDRSNEDHALEILKRTTSRVKPIMRKYGWVLPELAEFFPDNPNLLGISESVSSPRGNVLTYRIDVNGGQKILLRLRPHHSPTWFLDEDDIIQTMLHELTHNVHGPHDDKFYKFLTQLQNEYDELQRTGYAGEGFFTPGRRLGGPCHNPSPHLARLKAIAAAEKRKQVSRVLGKAGGQKLGGIGTVAVPPATPREMAAQAAERRIRDSKVCGSQQSPNSIQQESEKASREGITNDIIDLTIDDSGYLEPDWDSDSDEVIIVEDVRPTPAAGSSRLAKRKRQSNSSPPSNKRNEEWACQVCTLLNKSSALQCDACQMQRPPDEASGWACHACGQSGMPHKFWTCTLCGMVKLRS